MERAQEALTRNGASEEGYHMKRKTNTWKKVLGIVVVVVVLVAVAAAVFFRAKPMLDPEETPQIRSISVTYEDGGETYDCDIPQEGLSQALNDELMALLQGTEMRNTLFPPSGVYTVTPDYVYMSVWVGLGEGSMRVNLSTNSSYTSAQFGDTYYAIVDGQDLYQQVYDLVSPLFAEYTVKR